MRFWLEAPYAAGLANDDQEGARYPGGAAEYNPAMPDNLHKWPLETKCSRQICNALTEAVEGSQAIRYEPARIPGKHFSAERSWPDIWWLVDKTVVLIEVKRYGAPVKPAQRVKLKDLQRMGYHVLVVRLRGTAVCYETPTGSEILRTAICDYADIARTIDSLTIGILPESPWILRG